MKKIQNAKQLGLVIVILLLLTIALTVTFLLIQTDSTETDGIVGSGTTSETAGSSPPAEASQKATYRIEYDVTWSAESHPNTLPDGAHVSPIVIVSHANENDLFASGTEATDGIEMMAETGATGVLANEISDNSSILNYVMGSRLDVPDSQTLEIELDQDHPLLSAVSMLAPSPDWFIAANNVEVFKDGRWLEEIQLTMRPYDAGTDSETTFTTVDLDTDPAQTIGAPVDDVFVEAAAENHFATITITRQD